MLPPQSIDGKAGFTLQRGVVIDGRRAETAGCRRDHVVRGTGACDLAKRVGDTLVLRGLTRDEIARCIDSDQQDLSCEDVFANPGGPCIELRVVGVLRTGPDLRNRAGELSMSFLTPAFFDRWGDELASGRLVAVRLHDHSRVDAFVAQAQAAAGEDTNLTFETQNVSPVEDAIRVLSIGLLLFGLTAAIVTSVAVVQAVLRQAVAETDSERCSVPSGYRARGDTVAVGLGASGGRFWCCGWRRHRLHLAQPHADRPLRPPRRAGSGASVRRARVGGAVTIIVGIVVVAAVAAWAVDRRAAPAGSTRTMATLGDADWRCRCC